ncbi:MAG: trypsin-like peptidase domain-containing protein [Betaproteobacteria bacterium]
MSQQNTLYAILGVEASASTEEIEAAYAARLSEAQEAGTETSLLKIAHDDLRIPELRAAYDRKLARQNAIPELVYETVEAKSGGHRYSLWFLVLLVALGAAYWWKKPVAKSSPPLSSVQLKTENYPSPPSSAPPAAPPATSVATPAQPDRLPLPSHNQADESRPDTKTVVYSRPSCKPGFDPQCLAWSVFMIRQRNKSGSGVLIAPDRILTNCHVLAGGAINRLVVIHRQTNKMAKVEQYTRLADEDVCLLLAPGAGGEVISWGSSDNLNYGDTTYNLGHPGGSSDVIWSEAKLVGRTEHNGETYLATSNFCRPGSSGGPLLDQQGRLVGVVTAVQASQSQNDGATRYGACLSLTEATARKLLSRTFFPIAMAPAQFN